VPARCPPSTWAGVHGGGAAAAKGAARAREQPVPLRPIAAPARDEHAAARGGSRSRRCPCPQPPGASWEPAARGPRRPNEASMLVQTNAQGGMRAMAHWWRLSCSGERRAAPPHQNVAKSWARSSRPRSQAASALERPASVHPGTVGKPERDRAPPSVHRRKTAAATKRGSLGCCGRERRSSGNERGRGAKAGANAPPRDRSNQGMVRRVERARGFTGAGCTSADFP
jgi:hypothetical protein